jgi:HAD superfamily hydrolase (TIGR01509 family)
MQTRNFAAILLDFDGTTVDSEPKHCRAHQLFLSAQGIDISESEVMGNIGKSDRLFYLELMRRFNKTGDVMAWMAGKTEILKEMYRTEGLDLRPGIVELLEDAARLGVPVCLVTSTEREVAALGLQVVGLDRRIAARVCYEDVVQRKPHPEPYLLAAKRLGVPAGRCLVLEDSPNGVRSGVASGATTIGLVGIIPQADLLKAGAAWCVESLVELIPIHQQPGATSTFRRSGS